MKVYLDNCSLQRPLDDKSQLRIRLEAEAMSEIVKRCEAGTLSLVSSTFLIIEIERTPSEYRKSVAKAILSKASEHVATTEAVKKRTREFVGNGLKSFDAAHLACAEVALADYFCTCDDKLLKRARAIIINTKVVSPLELIKELEP